MAYEIWFLYCLIGVAFNTFQPTHTKPSCSQCATALSSSFLPAPNRFFPIQRITLSSLHSSTTSTPIINTHSHITIEYPQVILVGENWNNWVPYLVRMITPHCGVHMPTSTSPILKFYMRGLRQNKIEGSTWTKCEILNASWVPRAIKWMGVGGAEVAGQPVGGQAKRRAVGEASCEIGQWDLCNNSRYDFFSLSVDLDVSNRKEVDISIEDFDWESIQIKKHYYNSTPSPYFLQSSH